jgi:diguanylate cyclase (GGDEF)-like protein
VVQGIGSVLRPLDVFGRYGGDEFLIGLVEVDETNACSIVERLLLYFGNTCLEACGQHLPVAISIGSASLRPGIGKLSELIELADQAMYRVKEAHRRKTSSVPG